MASYLLYRKLFISTGESIRNLEIVQHGVSQGSNIGSLMFLIFIDDLPNSFSCDVKLFADDTYLLIHSKNSSALGYTYQ